MDATCQSEIVAIEVKLGIGEAAKDVNKDSFEELAGYVRERVYRERTLIPLNPTKMDVSGVSAGASSLMGERASGQEEYLPPPVPTWDTGDLDAMNRRTGKAGKDGKGKKMMMCYNCNGENHPAKTCTSQYGAKDLGGAKCENCKGLGHTRKDCPGFQKYLRDSNPGVSDRKLMKLPADYKGAYERARVKAGLPARRRRLNVLDDEDYDDDAESDFGEVEHRLCVLQAAQPPKSFESPNSFQALADEDQEMKSQLAPKSNFHMTKNSHVVRNEKELEALLKKNPRLAAVPETNKKLKKVMRNTPAALQCQDDEILCLVDSGATINAANVGKHFPAYKPLVTQTAESRQGDGAKTANGHLLVSKGRCLVGAHAQGSDFCISFKDMDIDMPILSVRKMVKNDNVVSFQDDGGSILNRRTGRAIHFYEHEGVYFVKLRIKDPEHTLMIDADAQGFRRQGI